VQYADYALWQREWLQGEILERQVAYWREQLRGIPAALELPTDRPRPAAPSYKGARHPLSVSKELSASLEALGRREGATLYMVLLAALQLVLSRWSGQDDIAVGSPVAGRTHRKTEGLIGFFLNTLVMRTDLSGDPTFTELLRRLKSVALGAYTHQDLPFEQLVAELQPERDLSRQALFQVMFTLQNMPLSSLRLPGLIWRQAPLVATTSKFDLAIEFFERDSGLEGSVEYATDLFDRATIERFAGNFKTLLEAVVVEADRPISELPLLTEAERRQLVEEWNETSRDYPKERRVHQLFEEQVKRTPEAVAAVFEDQQLTYRELNKRANRLAHYLRTLGAGPEARVGICLERSLEMVVGLLGILKAGGAYVPLDAAFPDERKAFMMTDSEVKIVLSTSVMELPEAPLVTRIDIDQTTMLAEGVADDPEVGLGGEALAYLMYTSGSTGAPKGVMVSHRAIGRLVLNCGYADFNENDRVAFAANPAFDAATMEVWAPLLNGGRIVVIDRDAFLEPGQFARLLEEEAVTTLFLTTAIFNLYAQTMPEVLARLDRLLCGGEKSEPASFARVLQQSGPRHLIHCYGPTETTTFAITHEVSEVSDNCKGIPLGRPIGNTRIYILDQHREPVPVGVTGELYIGGAGVARGYLNRPELTAERFVKDPFTEQAGARMYKTGDLGRWRADGTIEFLGRNDFQVKIRGFRVELGEIEARLAEHGGVGQAVVAMREDMAGDERLVAYYTCVEETERGVGAKELRSHLSSVLPEYMAPAAYVRLERFPLTTNGKVDRKALPAPDLSVRLERQYVAPRTPTEEALAQIWAEVLGLERVGIRDNFFELGGHSVFALAVISRANQAGLRIALREIFEHQTIDRLTAVLESGSTVRAEQGIIIGETALTPILSSFLEKWSDKLADSVSLYWLECRDHISSELLREAIRRLIIHHDALRLKLSRVGHEWRQWIIGIDQIDGDALLLDVDLSDRSSSGWEREVEHTEELLVSMVDVSNPPLIRAALYDFGQGRSQELLIAIHHWANDSVSFGILLEDLQTAYEQLARGQEVRLPDKTTSFKSWAEELVNYGKSDLAKSEAAFWRDQLSRKAAPLPIKSPAAPPSREVYQPTVKSLTRKETQTLLQSTLPRLGAHLDEVLLAALAGALVNQLGIDSFHIELMHHGREHSFRNVDVSRTVGWFSNEIPLLLDVGSAGNLREMVETVKEQARGIPNHGIGYGVLRYLNRDSTLLTLPSPNIRLNNQGNFGEGAGRKLFHVIRGTFRMEFSGGLREQLINISADFRADCLTLEWMYDRKVYEEEDVRNLADNVITQIRSLIALTARAPKTRV
jgi:amino acid adenylation domain-containing protein/non-ribosomal peptide synthase protein (TIGR01720 family)